jgi:hypothetical protein
VVVLAGATCTLTSGTSVTHDVVIEPGGLLIDPDVTVLHDLIAHNPVGIAIDDDMIGHDLRIYGVTGAAVAGWNHICGTTVGHNLVIADGSPSAGGFAVGAGTGCTSGPNTVGHDLLVSGNANNVVVGQNSVGHETRIDGDSFVVPPNPPKPHGNNKPPTPADRPPPAPEVPKPHGDPQPPDPPKQGGPKAHGGDPAAHGNSKPPKSQSEPTPQAGPKPQANQSDRPKPAKPSNPALPTNTPPSQTVTMATSASTSLPTPPTPPMPPPQSAPVVSPTPVPQTQAPDDHGSGKGHGKQGDGPP